MADRRMFPDHENRLFRKTCLSAGWKPDQSTFSDLFSGINDLSFPFQQCIHLFSAAHICCSHAHRQNYQPAPQNKQYAVPRISTEKQEYCEHCHCQKISRHIGNFIFPVLFPTHNVYLFSETPPHLHIYLVKLLFLSLFSMILLYHLYILKDMLIYVEFFPLYSYNLYKLFLYHLFYSL